MIPSEEGRGPGLGWRRKLDTWLCPQDAGSAEGWPAGEQAARGTGSPRTELPPPCLHQAPRLHAFGSQSLEARAKERAHHWREPGQRLC